MNINLGSRRPNVAAQISQVSRGSSQSEAPGPRSPADGRCASPTRRPNRSKECPGPRWGSTLGSYAAVDAFPPPAKRTFPLTPIRILVPSEMELQTLQEILLGDSRGLVGEIHWRRIGVGLVESAAGTAGAFAEKRGPNPSEQRIATFLLGIAGTFDAKRHPVGTAVIVRDAQVDGLGIGCNLGGQRFESLDQLGWTDRRPKVVNRSGTVTALTVAAASRNATEAADRHTRYPDAAVEDMESASAAAVASALGQELVIIRGISNEVGDRDHSRWAIRSSLEAAADRMAWAMSKSSG